MSIIKRLYYGTDPVGGTIIPNSEYDKAICDLGDIRDEIEKYIPDKKSLLESLDNAHNDYTDVTSCACYEIGFRDGARMMLDVLYGKSKNFAEPDN